MSKHKNCLLEVRNIGLEKRWSSVYFHWLGWERIKEKKGKAKTAKQKQEHSSSRTTVMIHGNLQEEKAQSLHCV